MGYSTQEISRNHAQVLAAGREIIEASTIPQLSRPIKWSRASKFELGDNKRLYIRFFDGTFITIEL